MKKKFVSTAVLFVVLAFASACSVQGAPEDTTGLVEALRTAGATVETGEPVDQEFLGSPGQIIRVNGADVQIFEYGSAKAMEADAATISPDGASTGTTMITWIATPHFFKSGRLIVLYVGDDAATLGLLEPVLGEQFAGG
jgi:hypothetical protein